MRFQVWAPTAKQVELVLDEARTPMQKGRHGWFLAPDIDARHGTDYGYSIDNGEVLPDPRSAWQPEGISEPSRVVDHAAFKWTDADFQARPFSSAIIYEIHIGTFTREGTFKAAISKLDHLQQLGVTHLELLPLGEWHGEFGWGYDVEAPYAPHHHYGTPDDLKRLVNECHIRGLAVLVDVVYNHLGPYAEYLKKYGPYFSKQFETRWGPELNFTEKCSDDIRRYCIDNAIMWLRDYHFDGLRIDSVDSITDMTATPFLEQLTTEVHQLQTQLRRPLVVIGETHHNNPRFMRRREQGGFGMDAIWSGDFHHAVHALLTGERRGEYESYGTVEQLAKAQRLGMVYTGEYAPHFGRTHGRPPVGIVPRNLVTFIQSHDQVGNRAQGDRLGHLAGPKRAKIAAALLLTAPFIPMLFQGEEWNASTPFLYFLDNRNDEAEAKKTVEDRKAQFGDVFKEQPVADPSALETFKRSKLNWDELDAPEHRDMIDWYRRLIQLRKDFPALVDGELDTAKVVFDEDAVWLTVQRGNILIACNLGGGDERIPLDVHIKRMLLASDDPIEQCGDAITLAADSVVIMEIEERHVV